MAVEYEVSSGNIFADLELENPVELLAKAELARKITNIIKHRKLKQREAGKLLNIDQPKISKLIRGNLTDFSIERLMNFIMKLDRDIEIVIKKRPYGCKSCHIAVSTV